MEINITQISDNHKIFIWKQTNRYFLLNSTITYTMNVVKEPQRSNNH